MLTFSRFCCVSPLPLQTPVAYLFVASVYTPVLPYSTALDEFLMLCFVTVIAQAAVHGVMFYVRERQKLQEEQAEQDKEAKEAAESDEDDDDEEEGDVVKPNALPQKETHHAIAVHGNSSHSEPAATEMVVVNPANPDRRKSYSKNAVAPAPETDGFPASPSVVHDSNGQVHDSHPHQHQHGGTSARTRHGTVAPLGADGQAEPPKKMNKRDRKRLRKKQAIAATNAARQEAIQRVQITNSFNPVRLWWASLGLTTIRKLDFFWFFFFSICFSIATAIIFGVAAQ